MHERVGAGCKTAFVLIQVGSGSGALLYLIPGDRYEDIVAPEATLERLSVLQSPRMPMPEVLLRAKDGF